MQNIDNWTNEPTFVHQAAVTDVARGMSVIPIALGAGNGKKPAVAWKQYQTRHATDEELAAWFAVNHGLARITGSVSGIVVVDYDPFDAESGRYRSGAAESFARLTRLGVNPEHTYTVATPRGGWHAYYRHDVGERVPTRTAFMPCV